MRLQGRRTMSMSIGDYVVKVRFQKDGASIDDKMAEYLQRLSEIHI